MTPLALLVFALAVARATRFVTSDRLTDHARAWVLSGRWGNAVRTQKTPAWRVAAFDFVNCAWCVSVWLAALAVVELVTRFAWWFLFPFAAVLALSMVAGLLSRLAD